MINIKVLFYAHCRGLANDCALEDVLNLESATITAKDTKFNNQLDFSSTFTLIFLNNFLLYFLLIYTLEQYLLKFTQTTI